MSNDQSHMTLVNEDAHTIFEQAKIHQLKEDFSDQIQKHQLRDHRFELKGKYILAGVVVVSILVIGLGAGFMGIFNAHKEQGEQIRKITQELVTLQQEHETLGQFRSELDVLQDEIQRTQARLHHQNENLVAQQKVTSTLQNQITQLDSTAQKHQTTLSEQNQALQSIDSMVSSIQSPRVVTIPSRQAPQKPKLSGLNLVSIEQWGGRYSIMLQHATGDFLPLSIGDQVRGWRLISITQTSATFSQGVNKTTLTLR